MKKEMNFGKDKWSSKDNKEKLICYECRKLGNMRFECTKQNQGENERHRKKMPIKKKSLITT